MNSTHAAAASRNDASVEELFVLTDEEILEIAPPATVANGSSVTLGASEASFDAAQDQKFASNGHGPAAGRPALTQGAKNQVEGNSVQPDQSDSNTPRDHGTFAMEHEPQPPVWLAEQMDDPKTGAEAREFWNAIQQAQSEAKSFREVFAKPEDARAAAERARTLDEFDAAFFGGAGNSPEQTSAARVQLAQRLIREDPAAFREMVFAGLRALQETNEMRPSQTAEMANQAQAAHDPIANATHSAAGAQHAAPSGAVASGGETQLAAYRDFEKHANEDLERSVGGAIERTLARAMPNLHASDEKAPVGARHAVPLQARLSAAIREDIEVTLKGDRQLGEQVAQVLSARRFDDTTRAQVVRLINDRAQQLVPAAARRVINDWTQTTLSAHRAQTQRVAGGNDRADFAPAKHNSANSGSRPNENSRATIRSGRLDYRKLSDEQILDL